VPLVFATFLAVSVFLLPLAVVLLAAAAAAYNATLARKRKERDDLLIHEDYARIIAKPVHQRSQADREFMRLLDDLEAQLIQAEGLLMLPTQPGLTLLRLPRRLRFLSVHSLVAPPRC
jgi:hypothetical protein